MALIEWSDALSIGIPSIDEEHRRLVSIINDLHFAMMRREANQELGVIFQRLIDYTEQHFAHEERLFDRLKYPDTIAHKTQHSMLTARVRELMSDFEGGKVAITIEVMEFLRDWLSHHIAVSDRRYAPFLKQNGIA